MSCQEARKINEGVYNKAREAFPSEIYVLVSLGQIRSLSLCRLFTIMLFSSTISSLALAASVATAASFPSYEYSYGHADILPRDIPSPKHTRANTRHQVHAHPHAPARSPKGSSTRTKTCGVKSHNDGVSDDTPYILEAISKCNGGGHVIFNETKYIVGTAMDLTNLSSIDLGKNLIALTSPASTS